jgi:NNP family nitrate/nitrite transporter-like MFS transporter
LPEAGHGGNFPAFLALFLGLFVAAGIGNGSTFKMIPTIFHTLHRAWSEGQSAEQRKEALDRADREAAATLGFSSAVAAFGGFFIPIAFGTAIDLTGVPDSALIFFSVFYLTCVLMTWWWYARQGAEIEC